MELVVLLLCRCRCGLGLPGLLSGTVAFATTATASTAVAILFVLCHGPSRECNPQKVGSVLSCCLQHNCRRDTHTRLVADNVGLICECSVVPLNRSLSRVLQWTTQCPELHRAVLIGITSTRKGPAATLPLSATSEMISSLFSTSPSTWQLNAWISQDPSSSWT